MFRDFLQASQLPSPQGTYCKHILLPGPLILGNLANFEKIVKINGPDIFEYIEFVKFWQPICEIMDPKTVFSRKYKGPRNIMGLQ